MISCMTILMPAFVDEQYATELADVSHKTLSTEGLA